MGSDLVPTLKFWDESDYIINNMACIIFERHGFTNYKQEDLPKKHRIVPAEIADRLMTSSTEVRELIKDIAEQAQL